MRLSASVLNQVYPVSAIEIVSQGTCIKVIRQTKLQGKPGWRGDRRGITDISNSSLANLLWLVNCTTAKFQTILTLTYSANYPHSLKIAKKHLNCLIKWMKRKYGQFDYLWVMEFQRRGSPHFHVLTSLTWGCSMSEEIGEKWVDLQNLEDWTYYSFRTRSLLSTVQSAKKVAIHPKTFEKIRSLEGGVRYITKYATKTYQKKPAVWLRDIGRFWGVNRNIPMGKTEVLNISEDELRYGLTILGRDFSEWSVLPKIIMVYDENKTCKK